MAISVKSQAKHQRRALRSFPCGVCHP
jgi:hypothetical protein